MLASEGSYKAASFPCPTRDPDGTTGCDSQLDKGDVVVRDPSEGDRLSPDEVVDIMVGKQANLRLKGHMIDCAADGLIFVLSTPQQVIMCDAASGSHTTLAEDGADRVAIGPQWLAWHSRDWIEVRSR